MLNPQIKLKLMEPWKHRGQPSAAQDRLALGTLFMSEM